MVAVKVALVAAFDFIKPFKKGRKLILNMTQVGLTKIKNILVSGSLLQRPD